jgi:hypothetical protein
VLRSSFAAESKSPEPALHSVLRFTGSESSCVALPAGVVVPKPLTPAEIENLVMRGFVETETPLSRSMTIHDFVAWTAKLVSRRISA